MNNSSHTGRAARTLSQAFGPYSRWDIERPRPFWERHLMLIAVVLFFVVLGAAIAVEFL